ncbi:MAG: PBP1A family penicillin-binding protein [Acidobacteria bacterium]|nr:PBP1A family penicillin-binding protein [Acidobacteriota bacterium]
MTSPFRRVLSSGSLEAARSWLIARPRVVVAVLLGSAMLTWATAGMAAWLSHDLMTGLPGQEGLASVGEMAQATTLLDVHDRPVFTIFREQRIEVPLDRISPALIKAMLAVEDQRFFEHRGVDVVRVFAALWANLRTGWAAQGGSTITQQLARQAFLNRDKTLRRKLKETILAARLEHMYSKHEILELYLNKIYFGDGFYGAQAASLGFFGKPASDLDISEAALLAGVVKSPSSYAPTISVERAVTRRNLVLNAMLDTGAISRDAYDRARGAPVHIKSALHQHESFGLFFKEHVRQELVERFGWDRVYEGGLRVYTTIDPEAQKAAEDIFDRGLAALDSRRAQWQQRLAARKKRTVNAESRQVLEAALLAVEPGTGFIRAMIGGRDFWKSRFNRATQAERQPGSAFKPLVYAVALEQGYTPATLIDHLDDPIATPQGGWTPEDEHLEASAITVRAALRSSSNRAAVRMLDQVGIGPTVQFAEAVGVGRVPSVPSLALGSGEVTLEGLVTAYLPFASGGYTRKPTAIRRVEDTDGHVLYEADETARRVISDTTAFLMADMLQDVVNSGTAARARVEGFRLPAGGKTGTTNEFADAWFVGFTPRLLTGVWIGLDRPQTILPNGFAGDLAVPLWARFMRVATRDDKPEWFAPPANLVREQVCRLSGQRAGSGCEHVPRVNGIGDVEYRSYTYPDYFVIGTEPLEECHLHRGPSILDHLIGVESLREAAPEPPNDRFAPPEVPPADAPGAQAPPPQGPSATEESAPPNRRGPGKK